MVTLEIAWCHYSQIALMLSMTRTRAEAMKVRATGRTRGMAAGNRVTAAVRRKMNSSYSMIHHCSCDRQANAVGQVGRSRKARLLGR
jgi:hypothetical protein